MGLILGGPSFAETAHSSIYTHDYWLPEFHHKRLSYCLTDETTCGKPVADVYCRKLGYDYAQRATKDHNIGLTSYLDKDKCCRGWECDGFNMIRCAAKTLHSPFRGPDFRKKIFSEPMLTNNMRLAWCFDDQQKLCGQRAATAFCRKMAFEKAIDFTQESNLAVTRQLGNNKVCFNNCIGFASITCGR